MALLPPHTNLSPRYHINSRCHALSCTRELEPRQLYLHCPTQRVAEVPDLVSEKAKTSSKSLKLIITDWIPRARLGSFFLLRSFYSIRMCNKWCLARSFRKAGDQENGKIPQKRRCDHSHCRLHCRSCVISHCDSLSVYTSAPTEGGPREELQLLTNGSINTVSDKAFIMLRTVRERVENTVRGWW